MVNSIRNGGQVTYFTESYAVIRYSVASVPSEYLTRPKRKKENPAQPHLGLPMRISRDDDEKKKINFFRRRNSAQSTTTPRPCDIIIDCNRLVRTYHGELSADQRGAGRDSICPTLTILEENRKMKVDSSQNAGAGRPQ